MCRTPRLPVLGEGEGEGGGGVKVWNYITSRVTETTLWGYKGRDVNTYIPLRGVDE